MFGRGRSWRDRVGFLAAGMGFGSASNALFAWQSGGFAATHSFGMVQWLAVILLGVFGGAAAFYLWVYALERTTPTRVANTMTVNPITASIIAALVIGEAISLSLVVGMVAVFTGIWIALTDRRMPLESLGLEPALSEASDETSSQVSRKASRATTP